LERLAVEDSVLHHHDAREGAADGFATFDAGAEFLNGWEEGWSIGLGMGGEAAELGSVARGGNGLQ